MRVRVGGPGTEWQDRGLFANGSAVAWGSSLCIHEHQAALLPAPAGAKRVARVTLIATWHGPPGSAALPLHAQSPSDSLSAFPPPTPPGTTIQLPSWRMQVELRAGHAGRANHEASVISGRLDLLHGWTRPAAANE